MMTSIGFPASTRSWVADAGEAGIGDAKASRGRVAQVAERLSDTEEEAGSIPAPPIKRGRVAQKGRALVLQTRGRWFDSSLAHSRGRSSKQVERPLEARGVAGSIPADHISGSVAQFGRAADS